MNAKLQRTHMDILCFQFCYIFLAEKQITSMYFKADFPLQQEPKCVFLQDVNTVSHTNKLINLNYIC
jgi:hypothetical protein